MLGYLRWHLLMEVYTMEDWKKIKKEHYMKDICLNYGNGVMDFNPKSMNDLNPSDIKSYDEYLDIQWGSLGKCRKYFEMCYYGNYDCYFKGKVERTTDTKVLFKRIFIDGMYYDGIAFDGKEDHVWMDKTGFEEFEIGCCLRFSAEVYRYLKKSNGKTLDFALRDPNLIEIIEPYEIPTDEELINQQIEQLVCETCLYTNNCYMGMCIANEKQRKETITFLKQFEPGKFTIHTVLAAYEITGQVFSQLTGGEIDKKDPNYKILKKILTEANSRNAGSIWPLEDAVVNMLHPEKPRLYIE